MEIWKNNKNNKLYTVIDLNTMDCTNSENEKRMVLYSSESSTLNFVREYFEFLEKFTFISKK